MNVEFRTDVPVMYELGAYRVLTGYPSPVDVLCDICGYVINSKKRRKKLDIADFKVEIDDLKAMYSNRDQPFMDKVKNCLSELHKNGMLESVDGNLCVTNDGFSQLFKN